MEVPFQVDKFHFNNHQSESLTGDRFSGFNLEDQHPATCFVFNEEVLTTEQIDELQRVNLILAQKDNENVLKPMAWGTREGRHYVVYQDFGRPLSTYENLKRLTPGELLTILRRLLKALTFADSQEVHWHGSISPANIHISLEQSQVKVGFFGYPLISVMPMLKDAGEAEAYLEYCLPEELNALELPPFQLDLYALGLVGLELATARTAAELLHPPDRLDAQVLRQRIGEQDELPLPVQELLYKLLTPVTAERYESFKQALGDVVNLAGEEETGLSFQTFILDTLINGRFRLSGEVAQGRISRVYAGLDLRDPAGGQPCVVKLVDLRKHPGMSEVFHTRFKQLTLIHHDHLLDVYDVGVHFENGYIAMESGLMSLEELLIKRGSLPLTDAGRIVYQLCKALEGLAFNQVPVHGAIKPSNVFLTTDLRTVKLGDALVAEYFLQNGNLNFTGAEYYNPEFIKQQALDARSDIYSLGTLFFEMLVGHPPFSFKIEQEIIDDHLHLNAATRIESALFASQAKDMILRMLEKNPAARYQTIKELRDELTVLLGYDKKEEVELPFLLFDFAEMSLVGKNAREKSEETLAVRLPAVSNRARGALALLIGHGPDLGDRSKAATAALKHLRELLFNPAGVFKELAKIQKTDPEEFLSQATIQLNERLYREAFAMGKTKQFGLSCILVMVQENTLYMQAIGQAHYLLFSLGDIIDTTQDKWTIAETITLGDASKALSSEVHERLGFGEVFKVQRLKRRLRDGDQFLLYSPAIHDHLSISEIRELVTSASEPDQAIELMRSDTIRRRLEGTISVVLTGVGNVKMFAEDTISHSKRGMLARNFLAQGNNYLNDGRIDDAIEQFTQALEINPNFAIIHHQLGMAYVRKGLLSYARSCFDRALELNSKLGATYVEIARLLHQQRNTRDVLPLLRRAAASGVKDAELFAMLGHELIKVRNYDEAVLYCSYALDLERGHPAAFRDRMIALRRRGALDTKLIKMFAARPRLAGDKRTFISHGAAPGTEEEEE